MCGRYVTPDEAAMERELHIGRYNMVKWINAGLAQHFDAPPSAVVPILRVIRDQGGERQLEPMHWGLIPPWAKGIQPKYSTSNCVGETILEKAAFKTPWKKGQRCIFPTQGFYEWQVQPDEKTKHRYYIRPVGDDELFYLGGIWDSSWKDGGEQVLSCTIITVPANELMAKIHNKKFRMPCFIEKEDIDTWLTGTMEQAQALVDKHLPSERMRAQRVPSRISRGGAELVQAVD